VRDTPPSAGILKATPRVALEPLYRVLMNKGNASQANKHACRLRISRIQMSESGSIAQFSASIRDLAMIKKDPDSAQSSFLSLSSEAAVKSKLIESSLHEEQHDLRSLQTV
jgi:hypothetical protein